MNDETQAAVTNLADSVSKGLVSLPRAKRQLEAWAKAGQTIEIGEAVDWLDRNVKKVAYEQEPDADGIIAQVDVSGHYDAMKAAAQKDIADLAAEGRVLTRGDVRIDSGELAQANAKAIDVSRRVNELTSRADAIEGVVDVDPETGIIIKGHE